MTNRGLFNWCVLIALLTGLYTLVYFLIPPLANAGVVYATFIALPIFFISGAGPKDLPNFIVSNITGVVWGLMYVFLDYFMGVNLGLSAALGAQGGTIVLAFVCFIVTLVCCAFHMICTSKTLFNKLPAMFAGIAGVFSIWGSFYTDAGALTVPFDRVIPLALTLAFGSTLAMTMGQGVKLLNDEGKWKFLSGKK